MRLRPACPDCGNAPTNHLMAKIDAIIAEGIEKVERQLGWVERLFEPTMCWIGNHALPHFFAASAAIGLGRILLEPDEDVEPRGRYLWDEGKKRGIVTRAYQLVRGGTHIYISTCKGRTIVFDMVPRPGVYDSPGSFWMDDKEAIRENFGNAGIPVPDGGIARTTKEVEALYKKLQPPLVTKPNRGSRSRHTTTHIESLGELHSAVAIAKVLSPWVVIEEELRGYVHRGTVIGGKVVGVLRREQASVVGDGKHTVLELIEIENKDPRRDGKIFHTIEVHDSEHEKELAHQGLSLRSIPKEGQFVPLLQKASRGLGGGATDLTDEAHPDNVAMLEKAAEILGDPLVGIDFIMEDVSKSWREQSKCGIIECNSAPFIELHQYPLVGKPRDAAGALWDLVFPESKRT